MNSAAARVWAIVPAAGSGSRMQSEVPKQYLALAGATVAEHTLRHLLAVNRVDRVVVALAPADPWWPTLPAALRERVQVTTGGASRAGSVLNALTSIADEAHDDDWALVHDMARPCLTTEVITDLLEQLSGDPVGGLLAIPVVDTLKRAGPDGRVEATVPRERLWRAQTPQVFRYGTLIRALRDALANGVDVTDEASAIEAAGDSPRLVEGPVDNIKITMPADLQQAGRILAARRSEAD